jgi:putative nucleotidyltransferase with HDIG domain
MRRVAATLLIQVAGFRSVLLTESRGLRPFVAGVVIAGVAVLVHALASLPGTPHPFGWMVFAALAIGTGSFTIQVASLDAAISIADTFWIASTLLFGPAPATVFIAIDGAVLSWRRKHSWPHVAFNAAAPAIALWAGSQFFFLLAGVPPLAQATAQIAALIGPLFCLTIVYFALNSGLMAIAVGLEAKQSPLDVWRRHFMWLTVGYLAAASVAFCIVVLFQQVGVASVAVILPVLAIFHLTIRSTYGRLDDARKHVAQVDRLYLSTIETLAMAIDAKDDVTHSHVRRVQASALALARALGVTDPAELKALEAAALLHDTGKLAVPERILNKPGGLTPAEFDKMKRHVDIGANILSLVDFPFPVVPIVRCHHEAWDGSGYPRGIKGEEIPIGARILSVVDCYDALTSNRPYRRALTNEAALDILRERRGRMYDPRVVDTFISIHKTIVGMQTMEAEHRNVLQQIVQAHQATAPVEATTPMVPMGSKGVLTFVSLARIAGGEGTTADALALASSLLEDLMPEVSGAWYVPDQATDQLAVAWAFGPNAESLCGIQIAMGDRLSGWVAANRQTIMNSGAALDLGERVHASNPPLSTCMSVPLMNGDTVAAVLTMYGREPFDEAAGRLVEMIAPHIARVMTVVTSTTTTALVSTAPKSGTPLRLVSNR